MVREAHIGVVLLLLLGACFRPSYDHPACSAEGLCPDGLTCHDDVCVDTAPADARDVDGASNGDAPAIDAAARICDRSDVVFCENFEGVPAGDPTSPNWTMERAGNPNFTIDGAHASGQHALHVTAPPASGYIRGVLRKNLSLPMNSGFVRYRVYLGALASNNVHASYGSAESATARVKAIDTISSRWMTNGDAGSNEWFKNQQGGMLVTAGRSYCLEFQLVSAVPELRVWIDGVARPDLTSNGTTVSWIGTPQAFTFPTFDRLTFGYTSYQPSTETIDVWIDDIVVAQNYIGCVD